MAVIVVYALKYPYQNENIPIKCLYTYITYIAYLSSHTCCKGKFLSAAIYKRLTTDIITEVSSFYQISKHYTRLDDLTVIV